MMTDPIKQNEYTWSAKYYDGLCNETVVQEDIIFYKSFLRDDFSILELGCGTGRVGIELGKIVGEYVGIDLSPQMLEVFNNKLHSSDNFSISLIQGDMTHFQLNKKFNLIIFPFRSFQALTSNQQRVHCLESCKKHLKKNGKIIIQIFNPKFDTLDNFISLKTHDGDFQDGNLRIERHTIGKGHDKLKQTIQASYLYKVFEEEKLTNTIEEPLSLGYMTQQQALALFKKMKLTVLNVYKWWDFTPVDNELKELIFVLTQKVKA